MEQVDEAAPATADRADADDAWAQSLRGVMCEVITSLPDHATLGELIEAAKSNRAMSSVLDIFTVRELIDTVKKRPKPGTSAPVRSEPTFDADGNPVMDLADGGPAVIRRRADVPDGDLRVLKCLSTKGPLRESDLANAATLTSEQLRIIVRHLRTKGQIHIEGSGTKRRLKLTRQGSVYLRKHS